MACVEWKVPCLPVKPWQITRVFLSTHTLAVDDMRAAPVRRGEEEAYPSLDAAADRDRDRDRPAEEERERRGLLIGGMGGMMG